MRSAVINQNDYMNSKVIRKLTTIGGILYLLIIITGGSGELLIRNSIIVSGNATETANNISKSEFLWRFGIAGDLVQHLFDIPLMLIFYLLLRPVNKLWALLALIYNAVSSATLAATKVFLFI